MRNKNTVTILSIDGGGIKGYMSALVLQELENKRKLLGKKTSLADCFDIIAGTSTGSLIALGLAAPKNGSASPIENNVLNKIDAGKPSFLQKLFSFFLKSKEKGVSERRFTIEDIVALYKKNGKSIFPKSKNEALAHLKQAITSKYDSKPLEDFLLSVFGDLKVSASLNTVIIPTYDANSGTSIIIKNVNTEYDFYTKDAARASSAAPTYFPSARISSVSEKESKGFTFLDGALCANNPSLCAYTEAQKIYPNAKKFCIVSLGTCSMAHNYDEEKLSKWGYLDWVDPTKGSPLFSMMSQGQSSLCDYHMHTLKNVDYKRIEIGSIESSIAMDDVSDENFIVMKNHAENAVLKYSELLNELAKSL